jgi:hypothetical protein
LAGNPVVGTRTLGSKGKIGFGETLETDSQSRARLSIEDVGEVQVEPGTRLRVLAARSGHKRLGLERGTIHAAIWAPPGRFVVDTPSAVAVDLGCAYTLQVDGTGAGLLRTTLGWVGFKLQAREAFIPAGAACATRPKMGPGTPYFEDASGAFREALERLDFGAEGPERRGQELDVVLSEARKRDALTLWHLLARVDAGSRGRIYDRLAALVPPGSSITREGILRLDQNMLDSWWNQLGLGDISLWRNWQRSWSE